MKNLLTVIAFAFVMVLGVQNTSAQNLTQDQDRPEVVAKTQTAELTETLGLTGDQSRSVFRALVANEVNYRKHVQGKDLSNPTVAADKKKFDDVLKTTMQKTLTEAQYKKWLAMQK
jgi:hypothetical protein